MRNLATPHVQQALGRLALLVMGHVVVFGLVYFLTVHTVVGRRFADASLRGAIAVRPLLSGTVERILDVVSVASLLGTVALVAVIALARLARMEGLVAIGILAGSNVSTVEVSVRVPPISARSCSDLRCRSPTLAASL